MNNNLQYKRTHKTIINAFLKIAEQKAFDKITVQEIMEEALVSRYTFYNHFKDKYEIAENLQDEMIENYILLINKVKTESRNGELSQTDQNKLWCQFTKDNKEFKALWNIHTETIDVQEKFKELFKSAYLEEFAFSNVPHLKLEAEIGAAIQTVLMSYFASAQNVNTNSFGEPIRETIINACLHLARLNNVEQIKQVLSQYI